MPALKKIGAAALAAFGWTSGGAAAVTANFLVVAGGAGGGGDSAANYVGGGGGAGGFRTSAGASGGGGSAEPALSLSLTTSYTVIVGAGGAGGSITSAGVNGSNSSIGSLITSVGGGGGAGYLTGNGFSGGSGGGGGGAGTGGTGGSGTANQGYAGGTGESAANYRGAGGGGAGAVGASGSASGNGGAGVASSISGSSVTYAGGGGGGGYTSSPGAGGSGGGGGGGANETSGSAATANTGSGGGGSGSSSAGKTGGAGGSGIVIISYAGAQQFGGGIVTSVGGNTIHTFRTSGTLSPLSSLSASYLIVAGGGGGGASNAGNASGGGGGAGGMLTGSGVTIDTSSTYLITVGAGGAGGAAGTNPGVQGTNSTFSMVSTAAVGGGYGGNEQNTATGGNGGSGGGAGYNGFSGGTGTVGQGNNGGSGGANSCTPGGGGAGAVGQNTTSTGVGGNGGVGLSSSISGTATFYAGGGGGAGNSSGGTGGSGGGGNGGTGGAGSSATANTGGGGGGSSGLTSTLAGGNGGSGIVVIAYAGSTQQMAGGSVTITGGNVIHTFTSSGYLTPLTYYSNSLRFRNSASAGLTRTAGTPTNNLKWTWSAWVKRGTLSATGILFGGSTGSANDISTIYLHPGNDLYFYTVIGGVAKANVYTAALLRDPAAWYHIVLTYDSANSTAADRSIFYINGIRQTLNAGTTYPALNEIPYINKAAATQALGQLNSANYFDGYMTNINFIDGQALTPNSFGTFNSYGVWQPINYGGSYGTNGFYLPFTSNNTSSYAGSFSTTNYLTLGGVSQLALGSGNWTIEFWYYANAFTTNQVIYEGRPAGTNGTYPTLGVTGTGSINFTTNATTQIDTGANTVTLNSWNHIAFVKNGSTTTAYLNGVARGSFTDTLTYITGGSAPYIATNAFVVGSSSAGINGNISNLRVVKGTAVYTSNFTVPTSPLTNITNTALLTLQSSTIVDNSSNALTITNVGSVTSPVAYPFNTKVFADQSPQGNNWIPNAVSGVAGSTYDYMTDVPTLTSATAANYCVWNPLNKSADVTVTNGNLSASALVNNDYPVLGSMGITTGQWYWEVTPITSAAVAVAGISRALTPSQLVGWPGSLSIVYFYNWDGNKYNSGSSAYGATYGIGDVIGTAFDATNGTITFYKNGVSQGTAFTGIPSSTYFPLAVVFGGREVAANFGQQPFKYTPPTGYVALNTYNL